MNKLYIVGLLILFNSKIAFGQRESIDKELKENIDYFRDAIVSFGMDTLMTFQDFDGKVTTKRIFFTVGTGVLFYFNYKEFFIPCLVTAKHVLRDSLSGWKPRSLNLRYAQHDTIPIDKYFGETYQLYGDKNLPIWLEHPDSTVDLAVLMLDPTKPGTQAIKGIIPYNFIPNDSEYFEGKEIFVLGYPAAVGLDLLNRAVLRRGIISWVPPNIQKSGSKMLIDCNIFPGNSGGPVFAPTKTQGVILLDTNGRAPTFYGIVSQRRLSYNTVVSKAGTIRDVSGNPLNSAESIGIGVIVTAKKVRELLDNLKKGYSDWAEKEEKKNNSSKGKNGN